MSARLSVMARSSFVALSLVLLAACGASFLGGSQSKTQCPGSQTSCLTSPSCSWDEARACEFCHCSPAMPPEDFTPQGPPRTE
jgi:hypothetical protein